MSLNDLNIGDKAKIIGFESKRDGYRNRLLAMGLTIGTEIILKRIAPLGDPVEVEVRGYSMVLRKNEADILKIEKI